MQGGSPGPAEESDVKTAHWLLNSGRFLVAILWETQKAPASPCGSRLGLCSPRDLADPILGRALRGEAPWAVH